MMEIASLQVLLCLSYKCFVNLMSFIFVPLYLSSMPSNNMFYLTVHNIFVPFYLSPMPYLVNYFFFSSMPNSIILFLFVFNIKTVGMLKDMKKREIYGVSLDN